MSEIKNWRDRVGAGYESCDQFEALTDEIAELRAALAEREWQPISTYDKLKTKPKFAVFFVEKTKGERPQSSLGSMIVTSRVFGFRTVTHWMDVSQPSQVEST